VNIRPDSLRGRPSRFGLWLAGIYLLLAAGLFLQTALTTKPGNVGLDWIPFVVLSMPWSRMDPRFAIPGVLLNGAMLWALGTALQKLARYSRRS
jgi:hypothetical protein